MEPLPVIFRAFTDDSVIALFPTVPASPYGNECMSYMHVGQHGAADYHHVLSMTRPAPDALADELHAELVRIGYDNLDVRLRAASWMHDERLQCEFVN